MSDRLRLVVGLGNPGSDYAGTRHNAGADFVCALLRAHGGTLRTETKFHGQVATTRVAEVDLRLFIPSTWMNHSGRAVAAICNYYRYQPESMLVAHDELDFEPGLVRLKQGGGPGGHNGVRDLINALGDNEFHRLRIGIGHPGNAALVSTYVLKRAPRVEQECIDASIDEALCIMPEAANCEWPKAMNRLHSFDARIPEQD